MPWNWQRADWPHFRWNASRLVKAEERFLIGSGVLRGTLKHVTESQEHVLLVESLSDEAITTSAIEGETLDRASVQSSIRRELGLQSGHRRERAAERGIGEVMVDLYRNFGAPLNERTLCHWQRCICGDNVAMRDLGRYRTHAEAMQVVSGPIYAPRIHFEAPPSDRVAREMAAFIGWFNGTGPSSRDPLPALTRAGAAHLYYESIHPFEDGNGRVGRAISEKALAQSVGRPTLTALAVTILSHRAEYYRALEAANKHNEITEWLAWFAGIAIEAQLRAIASVEFIVDKSRLLDRFSAELNDRQRRVLARVFREGPEGFRGGLSAGKYVSIAKTSAPTATRDLADLVDRGVLTRTGDRRHARYSPAVPVRIVPRITIDERGQVIETLPAR
jgi:Fic family protein